MTVREEIQAAINLAWANPNPETRRRQVELVGDSRIPTPEELVFSILAKIFADNT